MTNAIAYCSIAGVAIGAYVGLNWYVALLGAVILSGISIAESLQYRERLASVGKADVLQMAGLAGVGTAALASGTAYVAGVFVKVLAGG